MGYREIYEASNQAAEERMALVLERIGQIQRQPEVPERDRDYFAGTASFLLLLADICTRRENNLVRANVRRENELVRASVRRENELVRASVQNETQMQEESLRTCAKRNQQLYAELLSAEAYETSYANPAYAVRQLGEKDGRALTLLLAHFRQNIRSAFSCNKMRLTIAFELFVQIYNRFEEETTQEEREQAIRGDICSYFHDYSEIFEEEAIRRLIDPEEDFETEIVMQADLTDLRYLYRYGAYIGENELQTAEYLNSMSEEEIQSLADTWTEGYRIGFEVTGKELSGKQTVQIRYPIGFERVVRAAVKNFEQLHLKPTMQASGTSPNKQYDYDHREDRAFYLDKAYVERCLEVRKTCFEERKKLAGGHAGPAVIEVFGENAFSPVQKREALCYSEKQKQLRVYEMSMLGQQTNDYIRGEERSFTIIAFPIPEIGERYREIFAATAEINRLDYHLYRRMQQKLIDVLDEATEVHITGKGGNQTNLCVKIYPLANRARETAFENCVADVNIPVGEVFTSPVLKGTNGRLFVSQVYLNGLRYENLQIDFTDGMVTAYNCTNFKEDAKNQKYIRDNVLMHHETLPMGEFAIGTNTTAYRMAKEFQIADKLPILIAEKTGPHFALGDTCYSHEEDHMSYNPDGKAIVARENEISALRHEDMERAYFNCHTDITIPYDELDKVTVVRGDETTTDIISDGRFVLAGTEELNRPLEECNKIC